MGGGLVSLELRDGAANGGCGFEAPLLTFEQLAEHPAKLTLYRRGPRLAKVHIPVIDAAAIKKLLAGHEDGRLRSNGRASSTYQSVLDVTKDIHGIAELSTVAPDVFRTFVGIGIDQPKLYTTRRELVMAPSLRPSAEGSGG